MACIILNHSGGIPKDGKVNKIELWYKHTASGKIVTHYVFPDGSTGGAIYE
jgi:hypothetical protein